MLKSLAQENGGLWAERGIKLAEFSSFLSRVLMDTFEQISLANGRNLLPDVRDPLKHLTADVSFLLGVQRRSDQVLPSVRHERG